MSSGAPVLKVRDLRVRFGGLVAVDDVNLDVPANELRAVIGPNGAGKTTFFNAISGEVPLEAGRVEVAGSDVTDLKLHQMRAAGLARGYQVPQVFGGMTVRENLWVAELAARPERRRPFAAGRRLALSSSRVTDTCEAMGLTTVIDQLADELSHADQKVLDIGIALMLDPKVLLLDEPTQGVGPEEVDRLHAAVREATTRTTVLMIEHNMATVSALADRVTVLVNGAVLAEGTPSEITANARVQEVYMGRRPHAPGEDG